MSVAGQASKDHTHPVVPWREVQASRPSCSSHPSRALGQGSHGHRLSTDLFETTGSRRLDGGRTGEDGEASIISNKPAVSDRNLQRPNKAEMSMVTF